MRNRLFKPTHLLLAVTIATAIAWSHPARAGQDAKSRPSQTIELKQDNMSSLRTLKDSIEVCARTAENSARLRCHDRISVELGFMQEETRLKAEKELGKFNFWTVTTRQTELGEEITILRLDSANKITTKSGSSRNPGIVVRCKAKNTDVYLDWAGLLEDKKSGEKKIYLTYATAPGEKYPEEWELSLDYYGAFAADPTDFIRNIRGQEKVVFEITPHDDVLKTVIFNLEGFENALQMLVDRCYK